jgi:flagellin
MAMRIVNNIPAMTTQRWLSVAGTGLNKSIERLSSGYRINRAADDAAGLAISESFRADIASFKVASRNTSEASSLLQVAEGAMDQIGNMLIRLKELATQAASANVGSSERAKLDAEADALLTEIDRIANVTKYGSSPLLDGSFGAAQTGTLGMGAAYSRGGVVDDANDNIGYAFSTNDIKSGTEVTAVGSSVTEGVWKLAQTAAGVVTIVYTANGTSENYSGSLTTGTLAFANLGITITYTGDLSTSMASMSAAGTGTTVRFERTGLTSLNVEGATTGTYTISGSASTGIKIYGPGGTPIEKQDWVAAGETISFGVLNISFKLSSDYSYTTGELNDMTITVGANTAAAGNTFQIGAENNSDNRIAITVGSVQTQTLGIDTLDITTAANAQGALDLVDSAISTLAGTRGDIGAASNRLTYAAANLTSTIENVQAAESVIRDVDMAAEMTAFTKYQILLQAGVAMLAQANMAPQQVLALFG